MVFRTDTMEVLDEVVAEFKRRVIERACDLQEQECSLSESNSSMSMPLVRCVMPWDVASAAEEILGPLELPEREVVTHSGETRCSP